MPPITRKEFAAKIKAKYPDYAEVDDSVLVEKMVAKYPEYREQISDYDTQKKNPSQTTASNSGTGSVPTKSKLLSPENSGFAQVGDPIKPQGTFTPEPESVENGSRETSPNSSTQRLFTSDGGKAVADNTSTGLSQSIARPETKAEAQQTQDIQAQHLVNTHEAINRTIKSKLGANANPESPEYKKEFDKIATQLSDGDVIVSYDKEGKPGLKRMVGLVEGAARGWRETVKGIDEATSFLNMDNKQRIEYANKQAEANPNPQYLGEENTAMGEVGSVLGGVGPFAAKGAAGGVAAAGLTALAPFTGGASLAGLPAVAAIGFTAHDMMALDAQKRVLEAYRHYKQNNPEMSDEEAMEKANSRYVAGAVEGAAKSVALDGLLRGSSLNKPLNQAGKNVISSALKNTAKSANKMGLQFGGLEAVTQAEGNLEGVKASPSEVGETFVNHYMENVKVGGIIHGLMHEVPNLGKAVLKTAFFKSGGTVQDAATALKLNVDEGNIPEEKAAKIVEDLAGFEKALTQVQQPGMKPEVEASVAGLQQKINNLVEKKNQPVAKPTDEQIADDLRNKRFATFEYKSEAEVPDELKDRITTVGETNGVKSVKVTMPQSEADYMLAQKQHGEIDAEIAATNKQIDEIKKTENPAKVEVDEVTGKTYEEGAKEVVTPEGFKNRIHEGGLVLGEPTSTSHVTEEGYTYRSVGEGELAAIGETGGVFAREGKQKGGNVNTKYWSKGDGKFFYKDNQNVIRVKNGAISEGEVVKAKDLEVWDKEKNEFIPFDEFNKKQPNATGDTSLGDKAKESLPTTKGTTEKQGVEEVILPSAESVGQGDAKVADAVLEQGGLVGEIKTKGKIRIPAPYGSGKDFAELPRVLVRFGNAPTDANGNVVASSAFAGGKKGGQQEGVAVFQAGYDPRTGHIVIDSGNEALSLSLQEAVAQKRKIFLVDGEETKGRGEDFEVQIKPETYKVQKELNADDVVEDSSSGDLESAVSGKELGENFPKYWTYEDATPIGISPEQKIEPISPKQNDTVTLPPSIKGGMGRKFVFENGEWKQDVGTQKTRVGEPLQKQAQAEFDKVNNKPNEVPVAETKTTIAETSPNKVGEKPTTASKGEATTKEEPKPEPKVSVLDKKPEDVTVDDILNEIDRLVKEGHSLKDAELIAYHGSPHKFDKFSLEKVGTGEGAQAFGHGLYFTDLKDIADGYAKMRKDDISHLRSFEVDGIRVHDLWIDFKADADGVIKNIINGHSDRAIGFLERHLNSLKKEAQSKVIADSLKEGLKEKILETEKVIQGIKEKKYTPTGNRYQVSIHEGKTPQQYTWLEWDKNPTEVQKNKIAKAIKELKDPVLPTPIKKWLSGESSITGEDLYNGLSVTLGSDKNISDFLLKAGVDGVKYPAEFLLRGATSGNARGFNYVVFDENAVKIKDLTYFDMSNGALKGDKRAVEEYIAKAKGVLQSLYPKAKLETYNSRKEYEAAGGGEGSRGFAVMGKNGEHRILLNLEQIREDNSGKTAFHEVIHPIVYDAFTASPEKLIPIWNEIATTMQKVPGMEKVFEHTAFYGNDKVAAEGITETLTQIAAGNISIKDVPKSTANKIIELVNKMFEAVGINYKIKDVKDFGKVAELVKQAFEKSSGEGLKDVVKGKGIDKFIADYEKLTAKDIDPEHLKKLHDLLKSKVEAEIKAGKLTEEQAQKIYEKAGIKEEKTTKTPPPKTPNPEPIEGEGKGGNTDKAILNRLLNADGTPKAAKEGFQKEGLNYKPSSQAEAAEIAKSVIDSEGMDNALLMAGAGKFKGDTNSLIYAESLNRLAKAETEAKTTQEKIDFAKRYAEVAIEYDNAARDKGQFISAVNYFYKKSPLGIKIVEETKRQEAFGEYAKSKDKSWKEFYDELVKEPEFEEIIKTEVREQLKKERAEARAKRKDKVHTVIDDAIKQFKNSGATYSTLVPPKVITTALEGIKKAYDAGEKVVEIVQDAIDYISKEIGTEWDSERFREEWEKQLGKIEGTRDKKELAADQREKILERFRKKLKGMNEEQKDKVVRGAFKKLVENGALEYEDFKQIIGDVLGYGKLTPEESKKLTELVNDINSVDEIGRKAREEDRTPEALKAYQEAKKKAEKSATELGQIVYSKPDVVNRLLSIMQLNTLGIPSLVNNPIFNVWNQATVRFPIGIQLTVLDQMLYGASKVTNKLFGTGVLLPENNVFKGQGAFWSKLGIGAKQSTEQLFSGLTNADYFQKEVRTSQIHPFTSAKELWEFAKGNKPLTNAQKIDKGLQATVGVPAEIVARALNIGDKPQRYAAEGAQAAVFAKNLGIQGIDYKYFMEFPKEEAFRHYKKEGLTDAAAMKKAEQIQERIIKQGEESTFQQDNLLNDAINAAFKPFGVAGEVVKKFNMPFVKIPLNAFWSVFNLVNPEVALMQSAIYGAKALKSKSPLDIQQSKKWLAHAVTGMATMAAVGALAKKGVINPSNDDDVTKKERQGERTYEQQNSINMSKLSAYMRGDDPSKVKGGLDVDLKWFGNIGQVMNFQAKKIEDLTPEQKQHALDFSESFLQNLTPSALDIVQNGVFSNTSSLFTALGKGGEFGNAYLLNLINMGTNVVQPAMFAQMSRAQLPYYSKQKADSFYDEVKNNMLSRSSFLRNLTGQMPKASVGAWGDKLDRPDNVLLKWFGMSKKNMDNFAQPIYEDYKRTGNTKFLPSAVMPMIDKQKLTVSETEKLETLVGQARKNLVAPFINGMATLEGYDKRYKDLPDDKKIEALNVLYEEGFKTGKDQFTTLYPKYKTAEKTEEQKEETSDKKNFRKSIKDED